MLAGNLAGNPHSVCVEKNYKQIRSLYVYKRTDAYIYIHAICSMPGRFPKIYPKHEPHVPKIVVNIWVYGDVSLQAGISKGCIVWTKRSWAWRVSNIAEPWLH
jgi:hypothetical protein